MAYTKYSLTPADNNAAPPNGAPEGMLPSAVNDTMRDMMAQIRDVGDGIRGGTYTMTAPVITGGSITGVALSGNTLTNPVITGGSINNTTVGATTANTGAFTTLGATGVATFSAGTVSAPAITTTGDTNTGIFFPAADTIAFTEGGVESVRIDSSGNVGVGATPAAWSGFKALQINSLSNFWNNGAAGGASYYSNNLYYNGSNRIYQTTGFASEYTMGSGIHTWSTASSGTAGNTVTLNESMRIDASGLVTAPFQTGFKASKISNTQSISGSTWTRVSFNSTTSPTGSFNTGSAYSTSTNRFTAPVTGKYLFTASVNISSGASGQMYVDFGLNGSNNVSMESTIAYPAGDTALTIATVISMVANDTMEVDLFTTTATTAGNRTCGFSGQLLS
jgi:hypothetical protein